MRVLEIYSPKGSFYTGAAVQLRDLARGLAARGHRVVVVTRPSDRWRAESARGGFVHEGLFRSAADPVGAIRLAALLRRERIQVIHAHKGGGRSLALLARLFGPCPPLILNRGVSFPLSVTARVLDRSRLVTCVIAVCEAIKTDLVRQGMRPEKIHVVYSGSDTVRFDPARVDGGRVRAELSLRLGMPLITQIGVRGPKGNEDLLVAFSHVHAARPDARLLFVGARHEKKGRLPSLAAVLGLARAVTIWGYRDDVPEILAASDVSVDASHRGLGITGSLRESLAMQTPVVATAVVGNPELVLHERNGLLVPPRDPEGLSTAILRLLADPAWAKSLGCAGRKWVIERFSTETKIDRLEALYRTIAEVGD